MTPARPAVWPWYVAYAVAMALLYVLVAIGGVLIIAEAPRDEDMITGVIMAVLGVPFAIVYGVAPFLPKRSGAWIYHLVLICVGLTSACCMPAAIPLLVFWLKPETKQYFGRV